MKTEKIETLKRLRVLKEYVLKLEAYHKQNIITEQEHQKELKAIAEELDVIEKAFNKQQFDNMMGNPMEALNTLHGDNFNEQVHNAIEGIFK